MITIKELFEDVVAKVSTELGYSVYMLIGRRPDIVGILNDKSKNPTQKYNKYPAILVHLGYTTTVTNNGYSSVVTGLNIGIVVQSKLPLTLEARYATTFEQIDEIYKELVKQLTRSKYISKNGQVVEHSYIDRVLWSEDSGALRLPDVLDGREINFKELKINKLCNV